MTNIMEGMQYRVKARTTPGVYATSTQINAWVDVPAGKREFAADIEFRVKPVKGYRLTDNKGLTSLHLTKAELQEALYKNVEQGYIMSVRAEEIVRDLPLPDKLQVLREDVKLYGENSFVWMDVSDTNRTDGVFSYGVPTTFRVRPDTYYQIRFHSNGPVNGLTMKFDDSVRVSRYLDEKLRTDCGGFILDKVKY